MAFLLANVYRLLNADTLPVRTNTQVLGDQKIVDINSWLVDILSPECDVSYWQKVVNKVSSVVIYVLSYQHSAFNESNVTLSCCYCNSFFKLSLDMCM